MKKSEQGDDDDDLIIPFWEKASSNVFLIINAGLWAILLITIMVENQILTWYNLLPLLHSSLWAGTMTAGSCWLRGSTR